MKILSIPIILASSLVMAQDDASKDQVSELEALVIESSPLRIKTTDVTQAWSVLSGDELEKFKAATIGETLSNQPGVSQSFFGPSANRPMIRGLDKFRVRMLQNGTDTFDVSAQSEDHAVPVDPLIIKRVEVLRGSSALLYGGSAIGGVVNMIDRTIPTKSYLSPGGSFRSSYSSANDGWNYGAIGYAGSDTLTFQINGSKRDFKDYDAPNGFKIDGNASDKVLNSKGDTTSYGFGGSHFWDKGYAGISYSQYENTYGVPGGHAASETRLEMENDRIEARSEFEITDSDWLRGVELNFGYGDYKHVEISKAHAHEEDDHDDGHGDDDDDHEEEEFEEHAKYLREGMEARVALSHEIGSLKGVLGFHALFDELSIGGDESIFAGDTNSSNDITYDKINDEEAQKLAIFLIEEFELSESTLVNAGIRWEGFDRELATFKHDDNVSSTNDMDDSSFNASVGFSHDISEGWILSSNLNYSERVPDTAELFSYGPHHATEAFEIGNPDLDKETAVGIEVILRRTIGNVTGQLSAFHTKFDDYVYLEATGGEQEVEGEHMAEMKYEAVKAEFQGLEAEIDWLALENPGWSLLLSAYGDLLRGKNKSENTHLPRIAPARLGVGFEVQADKLRFGVNLNHVFKQNRIPVHAEEEHAEEEHGDDDGDDDHDEEHDDHAHEETATAAFSVLNAYATYDLSLGGSEGQLFVRGYNLADEIGFNHSSPSTIKEYAPIPAANVEIGLKFDF